MIKIGHILHIYNKTAMGLKKTRAVKSGNPIGHFRNYDIFSLCCIYCIVRFRPSIKIISEAETV